MDFTPTMGGDNIVTPFIVTCTNNRHVTRTLNIGDHYTVIRRRGRYVDLAELAHIRLGGMAVERFRRVEA